MRAANKSLVWWLPFAMGSPSSGGETEAVALSGLLPPNPPERPLLKLEWVWGNPPPVLE